MNDKQIHLIQTSWGHLAESQEELSHQFYKNLKRYLPERKVDLKKIKEEKGFNKVVQAIDHLVLHLPAFDKVENEFLALVNEFVKWGISKSDYATALVAFLNTLEDKLGRQWTPELGECWIFTFASFHQYLSRKLTGQPLQAVI